MPSQYDLPAVFGNASVEDVNKFNKLPFWLALNEVKLFPRWNVFDQLFGTIPWKPNMGNTLQGVTPQGSPVGETFFFPQPVTGVPNKNIYETDESTESTTLKWHRYESKQFSFLPSFTDFRKNQIEFAHKDITRQVQVGNNLFARSIIWNRARRIFVCGAGVTAGLQDAVYNDADASNVKITANLLPLITAATGNLSLRAINLAGTIMREDMAAAPFEGVQNMPKDNELIKGKYVLIGSTEAWSQLIWDDALPQLKSINMDLVYQGLMGSLFGFITYKSDRYPLRLALSGDGDTQTITYHVPELIHAETRKVRPNPSYTNPDVSQYEVAFLVGADLCRTVSVGPPPAKFANRDIPASKFYSMNWNGEIRVTDQVLITTSSGGNITSVDLNDYATQLKLKGQVIHGLLMGEVNNVIPILFKRRRVGMIV